MVPSYFPTYCAIPYQIPEASRRAMPIVLHRTTHSSLLLALVMGVSGNTYLSVPRLRYRDCSPRLFGFMPLKRVKTTAISDQRSSVEHSHLVLVGSAVRVTRINGYLHPKKTRIGYFNFQSGLYNLVTT